MRLGLRAAIAVLWLPIGLAACSSGGPASAPASAGGGSGAPSATASLPPAPASTAPSAPGASTTEVSPMPTPSSPAGSSPSAAPAGPFTLTSSAFAAGGAIPREYTCDGANGSPPLAWTGVPSGTAALVLLVDDPDARDFTHWTVLDLPGADGSLPKSVAPSASTPRQGTNDFGKVGWGGPCPPSGTHHYRFTLTALAAPLRLGGHPGGDAVRSALAKAKVLGKATLTATYRRG